MLFTHKTKVKKMMPNSVDLYRLIFKSLRATATKRKLSYRFISVVAFCVDTNNDQK